MSKTLTKTLRSKLLLANRHACCICGKIDVQIHHINSDNTDNGWENLAPLCLEHHDKATAPQGLTASLKPHEISTYKEKWEEDCASFTNNISRSRTAFFMVDYKNAERIRQLYAQLTIPELNGAYQILKKELIEEASLREEQRFNVSMEPNLDWAPHIAEMVEAVKLGDPHPKIFSKATGHPQDPLYPTDFAFEEGSIKPMYDIWCQIMIRCLILSRKTYDIENIMLLENPSELNISGSLITFNGKLRGDISNHYNETSPLGFTVLRVLKNNIIWLSKLSIKQYYVYSESAAYTLSDGRGNGVLMFRNISNIRETSKCRIVKFQCTPLIIGSGGGGTLKIN